MKSSAILQYAIAFAVDRHAGQYRKHGIGGQRLPYVVHPLDVMKTLWGWGVVDRTALAAAVLHDVIEDTDVSVRQIAKEFGEEVAQLVQELTHAPQDGAKPQYLERFATASVAALVIKLADRHSNLQHRLLAKPEVVTAYFQKSEVLLQILDARRGEITEMFGEQAARNIVSAYQRLAVEIANRQNDPPEAP
jgi:GTP pyrophosphokinase